MTDADHLLWWKQKLARMGERTFVIGADLIGKDVVGGDVVSFIAFRGQHRVSEGTLFLSLLFAVNTG